MTEPQPITFPAPTADWGKIIDPWDPATPHKDVYLSTGERVRVTALTWAEIDEIDPVAWARRVEDDDREFARWFKDDEPRLPWWEHIAMWLTISAILAGLACLWWVSR